MVVETLALLEKQMSRPHEPEARDRVLRARRPRSQGSSANAEVWFQIYIHFRSHQVL